MAGNLSLVFTDLLPAISVGNTKLPELSGKPPMNGLAGCALYNLRGTIHISRCLTTFLKQEGGKNRAWNNPPINISINYPATCFFFFFLRDEESPYLSLDSQSKEGAWFDPAKEMGVKPLCSTKQENITFALIIEQLCKYIFIIYCILSKQHLATLQAFSRLILQTYYNTSV